MGAQPIDKLTEEEFAKFKEKVLNKDTLREAEIKEIRHLFGIDKSREDDSKPYHVFCDEYHAHGYKCISFNPPAAGVVERLLIEIESYQRKLGKIAKEVGNFKD